MIALDGVSVAFPRGQFTAIMGPSGSGKSTLMHCLAGLDAVTAGEVWIGDTRVDTLSDRELTRLRRDKVGFIFQSYNLLPTLTAEENITLPLAIGGRKPDPDWMAQVIDILGLADRLSHRPSQLSGGQQQRVACARALVSQPEVIFADEPTGLLRAVGMRRGQVVGMVTAESVVISVFGALLGVGVGLGLGAAIVRALGEQGITELTLPWTTLGLFLALAVLIGLLAAIAPAVRAARVDVLRAIAYQ